MASREKIEFDHKGIGASLAHLSLRVPLNQREYSWEPEHVRTLLEDIAQAIENDQGSYFLGTIVLTRSEDGLEVTDGQQRLSTTAIFLAAVRDYFRSNENATRATSIEQTYLFRTDLATEKIVPRLRLNVDDNEFFTTRILGAKSMTSTRESHRLMLQASDECKKYLEQIVAPYKEADRAGKLVSWVQFIDGSVEVMLLTVPDHMDAFVMFETLNDRGLGASQADLLKNFLLKQAEKRISEAQQSWATMLGCLESLGLREDPTVPYLRCVVVCRHGVTREREVYRKVRDTITSQPRALEFVSELAEGSMVYAAIFNPEHPFWNDHGSTVRGHVRTLLNLRVEQIRPLIFAVMKRFDSSELKEAFKLFVSWSVRFLIAGGGRGGVLDRAYSERASDVYSGSISTAKELAAAMDPVVPQDPAFQAAFREARVSQGYLARYYLRALEMAAKDQSEPETVPNDDKEVINLEHIMPVAASVSGWDGVAAEDCAANCKRLGNMALLKAKKNAALGNNPFTEKRDEFQKSGYLLTKEVGDNDSWGVVQIQERQSEMADLALKTWPISS